MTAKLSSWNETATKQAILDFVATVTDKSSPGYVPPSERVATFDNDGTLWCEWPLIPQAFLAMQRLTQLVEQNPKLRDKQPYKAAVEKDMAWFEYYATHAKIQELIEMLLSATAGETQAEFEVRAGAFLEQARHSRFKVPYTSVIFQPMRELLDYLRDYQFKVFIVSGGGRDLMQLFSEPIYGIPRENVIGSRVMLKWEERPDGPVLVREAALMQPFDNGPGKPELIQVQIGRHPILAAGNSDGDIEMLRYSEDNQRPWLCLLVDHDDAEREYTYDAGAKKSLKLAKEHGWTVVSMKNDWKTVFAFEKNQI